MMDDRLSAPKADALPGCATPRTAVSLGNAAVDGNPSEPVRGNERQDEARTGNGSPGIIPNPDLTFTTRAELEAWAKDMAGVVAVNVAFAQRGEPEHADRIWRSALDQVRRVTLAHVHLGEG